MEKFPPYLFLFGGQFLYICIRNQKGCTDMSKKTFKRTTTANKVFAIAKQTKTRKGEDKTIYDIYK